MGDTVNSWAGGGSKLPLDGLLLDGLLVDGLLVDGLEAWMEWGEADGKLHRWRI